MFLKLEDHRSRLQLCYKGPRVTPLHRWPSWGSGSMFSSTLLLQEASGSSCFTDDQVETQAVCSPQHFPRSHQIFKCPFALYLPYCIYSKRCSIPKAQRLCLRATSTTASVVERQCSSYVVIFSELPKGPIWQQHSLARRQCQAWGPYSHRDVIPLKALASSPLRKHGAGDMVQWIKP